MWVKLKVSKTIMGKQHGRGEWVEVGTGAATKWIASGHAEALNFDDIIEPAEGIGIIQLSGSQKAQHPVKRIPIVEGGLKPQFERNLFIESPYAIMDKNAPGLWLNVGKMAAVFELLKSWDVVLILHSYTENATKASTVESEITRSIVHDLRVLYYQNCAIGVRDSAAGRAFCEALAEEFPRGRALASLRALYRVMPLAYYLPPDFGKESRNDKVKR